MTLKRVAYIGGKVARMAAAQRILSVSEAGPLRFSRISDSGSWVPLADVLEVPNPHYRAKTRPGFPDNRKGRRKRKALERKL